MATAILTREDRAAQIVATGSITALKNSAYMVESQSRKGQQWYYVQLGSSPSCNCEDRVGRRAHGSCKHIMAVDAMYGGR